MKLYSVLEEKAGGGKGGGKKGGGLWRKVQILKKGLIHGDFSTFRFFPEGKNQL